MAAKKTTTKRASKAKAASLAESVKKDHALSGRPVSPTDDPTDHSASAAEIAGQTDPKGRSGATVNAESIDKLSAKADEKEETERAEEDNSFVGKLRKSGLYFVRDHSTGLDYIGESPQNDPKASDASKLRSTVMPLDVHPPRTGMQVRVKDGDSFAVGEGFGPDAVPGDWMKVLKPDGKPLFS